MEYFIKTGRTKEAIEYLKSKSEQSSTVTDNSDVALSCQEIYNQAIDHCMELVRKLNDEVFPETPSYSIINNELTKLKKQ